MLTTVPKRLPLTAISRSGFGLTHCWAAWVGRGCTQAAGCVAWSGSPRLEALVDADLDTLATALYVTIDDLLRGSS